MEVSSLLVEGGDLTHRFFGSQKVDPPTNTLAVDTDMFRDPFLDQFFL